MKENHTKRILKKLLFFLPILLMLVIVNFAVDPSNSFRTSDFERQLADWINNGYNIEGIYDFDERIFQEFCIEKFKERKEVIVLGSSRGIQINQEMFFGKTFFNNCVSGASLEDLMAVYNIYDRCNLNPDIIILSIDPWMFNKNNDQTRWMSISDEYWQLKNKMGFKTALFKKILFNKTVFKIKKYSNVFSISHFQHSIHILLEYKGLEYKKNIIKTLNSNGETNFKISDGSINYGPHITKKTQDEIKKGVLYEIAKKNYFGLNNFKKLNPRLKNDFEKFIEYLESKNVKVVILLFPYHPIYYKSIENNPNLNLVPETEIYLKKFAEENSIDIYGSYNPNIYDLNDSDFYDEMHLKKENIPSIFKD